MSSIQQTDSCLFVSVVIATSDRYELLEKTMQSLRNQSFHNFEVILVCKEMNELLIKLAQRHGAKLFEDSGKGRCYARNLGVHKSIGDVVVFLDDDVKLEPNWLELTIKNLQLNQVGGAGGMPVGQIDLGDVFPYSVYLKLLIFLFQLRQIDCWNFCSYKARVDFLSGCNVAFHRDVILKVGGFDENFYEPVDSEDLDLCLRVRKLGFYLVIDPTAEANHDYDFAKRFFGHKRKPKYFFAIADNATYCRTKNNVYKNYLDWGVFFSHQVLRALNFSIITKNKSVFFSYLRGVINGFIRGKYAKLGMSPKSILEKTLKSEQE